MKTVAAASAALLSLASLASAQQQQTKPFWLVIKDAGKYNGAALVACHEGAAIEGLCVGDKPGHGTRLSTFQFNTTAGAITSDPNAGETGTLTYALPVNGGVETESEPMQLYYNQASNVALALFEPVNTPTQVAFDKQERMNIQSYIDDTVVPAKTGTVAYYRWYLCQSYYAGYQYVALSWVAGKFPPENPSCEKVEVDRVFLPSPA